MPPELTPERARELALRICRDNLDHLAAEHYGSTPRGICESLRRERERPWLLDDAELLWNLADIAGVLDTELSELGIE